MQEYTFELTTQYITENDSLCEEITNLIDENQVILLVAPQGTGKSTFITNLEEYHKLFISPTLSTAEQVESSTNAVITRGRGLFTFKTEGNIDRFGNPLNDLTSTTFGSADGIVTNQLTDSYDILIVDEVHKLVQYSTFGYDNVISVLRTINTFLEQDKKVLFTTATPELLTCFEDISEFPDIQVRLNILTQKKYISECVILNYVTNEKLLSLLVDNKKEDNFQILLYNNKKAIKEIENNLKDKGIMSISVNGKEYRENREINHLVNDIKEGIYHNYSALLATSWMDVGLNFIGENITHIYCIFDSEYINGDFTTIKQFMARTRKSLPVLYISRPIITKQEQRLLESIEQKGIVSVKLALKEFANNVIKNYELGYLKNIDSKDYYGLYQDEENKFEYSDLTLNYQLEKLHEKHRIIYDFQQLKDIFLAEVVHFKSNNDNELTTEECIELNNIMMHAEEIGIWYSVEDMKRLLKEITNGRIVRDRPKQYVERYLDGYKLRDKNKSIYGKSKKGYIIEKLY